MKYNYAKYNGFMDDAADPTILTDVTGRYRTESLFVETIQKRTAKRYDPLYSMTDKEKGELPSAYLIYMTSVDEYDAAMKLVGSLKHWRRLLECEWFVKGREGFDGLTQWREDMAERDKSTAKRSLIAECARGNAAASRALVEFGGPSQGPGRPPSKAEREAEERRIAEKERQRQIAEMHKNRTGD